MNRLKKLLQEKSILISDGAWGTMLHAKGLPSGECPELWNITHPDKVREIPRAYKDAGSEVILTNSFGGSPIKLRMFDQQDKAYELNLAAAQISRQVAGEEVAVLASVGPTGQLLEPYGEISEEDMIESFRVQIRGLVDGGADAILIETMSDIGEASCAVKAAQEITDLPIIVSMTFERGKEFRTIMGQSIPEIIQAMTALNVDILGTNCGYGTEGIVSIVREMAKLTDKPIIAHPNAGLPVIKGGETVFPESPEEMASYIPEFVEAGAKIIGGCCGTRVEHIRAIAKEIKLIRDKQKQ